MMMWHTQEERDTQLLSLQALLYVLPLSAHRRPSQGLSASGGGLMGDQTMMGTPTKSSLLFSKASRVGGRTPSRAPHQLSLDTLLRQYALGAHLAAGAYVCACVCVCVRAYDVVVGM